jgi:Coenzyme PQQ synthesis protein D (PqqD)
MTERSAAGQDATGSDGTPVRSDSLVVTLFADGGVLVDLGSGAFYRLNTSAAQICAGLLQGQAQDIIARDLARRFGISQSRALLDVEAVRRQLHSPPAALPAANPITFRHAATGYTLCWQDEPVWHLDPQVLTYLAPAHASLPDRTTQLLWVVPHLLLLKGQPVLHASAVEQEGLVCAFCGPSGRGKTTLARTLGAQGLRLVGEDLLLVVLDGERPEVLLDGETLLRRWVAAQVAQPVWTRLETQGLDSVRHGPRRPLREILFPVRVSGSLPVVRRQPLPPSDALVRLLENSFAELAQPALWRQLLEVNRRLVETTRVARLEVPEGIDALASVLAASWKVMW